MGMFDYVHYEMDCPVCGNHIVDFQSKDEECFMDMLEPDSLRCFYSSCKCGAWIEFSRPRPEPHPLREKPLTQAEVESMGFVMKVTK